MTDPEGVSHNDVTTKEHGVVGNFPHFSGPSTTTEHDKFTSVLSSNSFQELLIDIVDIRSTWDCACPHYIGGIYSQLRPAGWIDELCCGGVWDEDAHFLLDGVVYGFRVVDPGANITPYECENYASATKEPNHSKLQDLLIDELDNDKMSFSVITPTCVHALGVITKPSGAIRPITDCKRPIGQSVNSYMQSTFSTFSYVTVDDAIGLMSPGCWMSCVDLQSAYRSVCIHPGDRKFCGLSWNFGDGPVYLTDNCISFGQRSAPFIFARLTDFVTRSMHRRGYNCLSYLDDFFLVESSQEKCNESMSELLKILRKLGFYIAYKKLSTPSQQCKFLGIILDSVNLEARLPDEKLIKLHKELEFFRGKKRATLRQIQRLTGVLCHASKVVYGGRPYTQHIIDMLKLFKDYTKRIRLPVEFHEDLSWWRTCAKTLNGKTSILSARICNPAWVVPTCTEDSYLISQKPSYITGSVSSRPEGEGILFSNDNGIISCGIDIAYRYEMSVIRLLSVLHAAYIWGPNWLHNDIFLLSRSRRLVRALRKGRSISNLETNILRELFWLSVYYDFRLIPFYI